MALQLIAFACKLSAVPNATAIVEKLRSPSPSGGLVLGSADAMLVPVPDQSVSSSLATGYFLPRSQHIVGIYAAAEFKVTGTISGDDTTRIEFPLQSAQLFAPALLRLGPPAVEPIAMAFGEADTNVSWLFDGPIAMGQNDLLQAQMNLQLPDRAAGETISISEAESRLCVIVILADELVAPPPGEVVWVRFGIDVKAKDLEWSTADWNYAGGLPAGRYAIVGMTCQASKCLAARIVFPGQTSRPGVIATADRFSKANDVFYGGKLGIFGTFESFAPPTFEFLCTETSSSKHINVAVALMKLA